MNNKSAVFMNKVGKRFQRVLFNDKEGWYNLRGSLKRNPKKQNIIFEALKEVNYITNQDNAGRQICLDINTKELLF